MKNGEFACLQTFAKQYDATTLRSKLTEHQEVENVSLTGIANLGNTDVPSHLSTSVPDLLFQYRIHMPGEETLVPILTFASDGEQPKINPSWPVVVIGLMNTGTNETVRIIRSRCACKVEPAS